MAEEKSKTTLLKEKIMSIEKQTVELLKSKKLKLATAESCTGGLISKRITDVSGSSEVFEGGVVCYSNRFKENVLGVSPETLKKYGAVSRETAREMVKGVLSLTKADIAVAVTGIAGPSSDDTNKPVGLVYIAVSDGKSTIVKKLLNNFTGDVREQNRSISADTALEMIMEAIR
jgi:nicotinamide-nucleotide amidase